MSGFPLPCLNSCIPCSPLFSGRSLWGLPSSSTYLFLHATACGLRRTSIILTLSGCFVLASGTLKPWPSATSLSRSCTSFQGARSPLRPTGFSVYASPISCSQRTPLLRNGRKTRYRRVVSPYPAGTLTQQDTPSLSWRDNAQGEARGLSVSPPPCI